MKPSEVQGKFFQLVEFLVDRLRFVPCKELIAVSLILKAQQSVGCCTLAAQSLATILKFDPVFKDVFREVGKFYFFVDIFCQPQTCLTFQSVETVFSL